MRLLNEPMASLDQTAPSVVQVRRFVERSHFTLQEELSMP